MRKLLFILISKYLKADDVEWIVNDYAEIGVKIGNRFFFLYKAHSLEYKDSHWDNKSPILWRHHYKREFGECCHPDSYWVKKESDTTTWKPGTEKFQYINENWAEENPGDGWKKIKDYHGQS